MLRNKKKNVILHFIIKLFSRTTWFSGYEQTSWNHIPHSGIEIPGNKILQQEVKSLHLILIQGMNSLVTLPYSGISIPANKISLQGLKSLPTKSAVPTALSSSRVTNI